MSVTDSACGDSIAILITLSFIIILYYRRSYRYWKRKNLPYLDPKIPFGNFGGSLRKQHIGVKVKHLYDAMRKNGWKHGGVYSLWAPIYLVTDLEFLKNIMTKDFQYFTDRGIYHNEKADPISAHLFNIGGVKWRNLRTKLTPTFTSGKMKSMFQSLMECEGGLRKKVEMEYERGAPIDIKEVLGCFTTDIIGSCAFGLECNSFESEDAPFRVFGRKVFERSFTTRIKRTFANFFPKLSLALNVGLVPKDMSAFFMKIVKDTVEYREKNDVARKDFLQLLIDLKNEKHEGTTLTIEEIAAQSFVFFIAGFETSSTTMTFALYELARNQEIQDRAREEIDRVLGRYEGRITYDAIQDMKYLSQVIDEALRKYPPGPVVPRKCVKEYRVPGTDVIIDRGTIVLIPILGIHHDEEYYPDPEKFDPERFNEEKRNLRHGYAYIPFGEGPRICIGMRFGLVQSKVGLASLLRNFKFTVNEKTREPLEFKKDTLVLTAKGEIWLDAHKV